VVWAQNHSDGFPGLGLKTGSSGLIICASKSPRRFLDLDLKTKRASVCRLRHKIDRGRTARDTRHDLVACFGWKQVALGFLSLSSRLVDAQRRVVYVPPSRRLRRDQIEDERVDATGFIRPYYPYFIIFYVLSTWSIIII
jgi:hypothetical protein